MMKMNFNFNLVRTPAAALLALLAALALAPTAAADGQQPPTDVQRLEQSVRELQEEVARLRREGAGGARVDELERRIDLLAAELEKVRTASAAPAAELQGTRGLAPAAAKVYGIARGVSIGGYGEVLYQDFAGRTQAGAPAARTDSIDFLRQIVYVGYKFTDRLIFNSEIEFEHGSTEHGGAVSVEFGYVEYAASPRLGLRAGMLLLPMGFINELHEPPIFHGARRPEVERLVIPATWSENGAGLFGEAGPLKWRAYVVAGLSSAGFEAEGIREGRQGGAESLAADLAFTGRADVTALPGLLVGASLFSGNSGQGATVDGTRIEGKVTLFEGHAQLERAGLQLRLLGARSSVGDAALISARNGLSPEESVGERQFGWYAEAAYDVMTLRPAGRWSVSPFLRYEKLDTQERVPAGRARDPETARTILTAGVGVKPIPNVVFKLDHQWQRNRARSGVNQFNVAVGYLF